MTGRTGEYKVTHRIGGTVFDTTFRSYGFTEVRNVPQYR